MTIRQKMYVAIPLFLFCSNLFSITSHPQSQTISSVPFVGCASDGQLGQRKAPRRKDKKLLLSAAVADKLAYYEAQEGSGVLAPRGWHCFGTYGSNGGSLFVTPQIIDSKLLFSTDWKGFSGPVIQITDELGGTSGRFGVAAIIARVFPTHKAFVTQVIDEGIETAADFPSGPYPKDKLVYRNKEMVEYETPPQTEGLGTRSRLQKNDKPIAGVAILSGTDEELNLSLLFVRLAQSSTALSRAIIQQTEHEATTSSTY